MLHQIKRLFGLHLDVCTLPSKFISDFHESREKLSKSNAKLVHDKDTLCALLLVAIQDDTFESVTNWMPLFSSRLHQVHHAAQGSLPPGSQHSVPKFFKFCSTAMVPLDMTLSTGLVWT